MCEYGLHGFFSVARLGDNGNVSFDFEQGCQRAEYHALVLRDHHANGLAIFLLFFLACGIQLGLTSMFSGFCLSGIEIVSLVPA
jgi:hypothetical protein